MILQPTPADARMLLDAGVAAYLPAPYYPHAYAANYGNAPSDFYPYYGGGVRYWH